MIKKHQFEVTIDGVTYNPKGFYYQGAYVILVGDVTLGHTIRRKEKIEDVEIKINSYQVY